MNGNLRTELNILKSNYENKGIEIRKLRTDLEKTKIDFEEKIENSERLVFCFEICIGKHTVRVIQLIKPY